MKTLILTAALVVLTTATFSQSEPSAIPNDFVMAGDEISVVFYPNSSQAVTMILSKEEGQTVKVRVTDSNEKVLYTKRFGKVNKAMVKYDVSNFPSGEYTFELLSGKDVLYSKKFTKREGTVAMVN